MLNKINKAKLISILVILYIQVYLLNALQKFSLNGANTNSRWLKNQVIIKYASIRKRCRFIFTVKLIFYHCIKEFFCQIIGIPMGSDLAPFFANLFYTILKVKE